MPLYDLSGSTILTALYVFRPRHPTLKLTFDGMLGMAKTRQDNDFSLLQNSSQITFARSYQKMAEFLPSIMSLQVTAPYYVTVGVRTSRIFFLANGDLQQRANIRK